MKAQISAQGTKEYMNIFHLAPNVSVVELHELIIQKHRPRIIWQFSYGQRCIWYIVVDTA